MKKFMRWFVWIGLAAILVALIVVAARPQPVLVDVAVVSQGDLQVTVNEDGLTRIKERYIVSTPLSGRLERVSLEVGDAVVADTTTIARMQAMDPSLLDPRAVAQANARVSAAERRLEAAEADLRKAKSSEEYAVAELERAQELADSNVVSEADLDAREMQHRVRAEEVKAASFQVDIAEYELAMEKAALMLTRPIGDSDSPGDAEMELNIKAPIHGRVLRVYRESAAVLDAGASIIEVGDPLDLEIVIDVLSEDAVRIESGATVFLDNWGGAEPLRGEVRVVEPSGFTKLSALGVEEQRVNVIVDLIDPPDARPTLGDGFRVDARIVIWQGEEVVKVPTSSLFRVGNSWGLFRVLPEGTAELVQVDVGHNNGSEAEIVGGLSNGDTVIVHPSDAVADGVMVSDRAESE